MASQTKKETLLYIEKANYLGQSTQTQQPLVNSELTETFSVISPMIDQDGNERSIDWSLVQQGVFLLLSQASRVLQEASLAFRMSKVRLVEFHRRRKVEIKTLAQRHASLKKLVTSTYEPAALPLLGLEVPVSAAYSAVRARLLDVSRRMRNPDLVSKIGDPKPGMVPLDFDGFARGLEDAIQAYDDLESELTEAKKVRDESFIAREQAAARQRRIYVNLARVQEGLYRLTGLDELADRIRVTIPVRKPTPQDPEPDTPDQQPGPDGAPVEDPASEDPASEDPASEDPASEEDPIAS